MVKQRAISAMREVGIDGGAGWLRRQRRDRVLPIVRPVSSRPVHPPARATGLVVGCPHALPGAIKELAAPMVVVTDGAAITGGGLLPGALSARTRRCREGG